MYFTSKAVTHYFKHLLEDEYVCQCGRKEEVKTQHWLFRMRDKTADFQNGTIRVHRQA